MKCLSLFFLCCLLACAAKAPVQEMADARAAVNVARALHADDVALQSAERSLTLAADAIQQRRFQQARRLALSAKQEARASLKKVVPDLDEKMLDR